MTHRSEPVADAAAARIRGTLSVTPRAAVAAPAPATLAPAAAGTPPPDVRPPRLEGLTNYRVVGRGAFSEVFRADQRAFGREVAIKVLTLSAGDAAEHDAFRQECEAMGRLSDHPHIAKVYDAGVDDLGRPYIVMAYCPGGSLTDRVNREGPLPLTDVLRIGVEICDALHVAHQRRIVHCDVKPSNILLSSYEEPVLSDFGVAVLGRASTGTSTAVTPGYAPPELLRGERPVPVSDVYSLCATLYFCLTGAAPYARHGDEPLGHVADRISHDPLPGIIHPEVTSHVEAVIVSGLLPQVEQRPSSAADLGRQLQVLQATLGHSVTDMVGARRTARTKGDRRAGAPRPGPRGPTGRGIEPLPGARSPSPAPVGVIVGPATLPRRAFAAAIDAMVGGALLALATTIAWQVRDRVTTTAPVEVTPLRSLGAAAALVVVLGAQQALLGTLRGQTLGRMWTSTAVIDTLRHRRLTVGASVARVVVWWLCALPLALGFVSVFLHPEGRGWPDRTAGSAVVTVRRSWPASSMALALGAWLPFPVIAGVLLAWS